jgi:hypothetical protein
MLYESASSYFNDKEIDINLLTEHFNQVVRENASYSGIYVSKPTIRIINKTLYTINESTGNKEKVETIEGVVYYWTESDPNEERPYIIKHLHVPAKTKL